MPITKLDLGQLGNQKWNVGRFGTSCTIDHVEVVREE